MANLPLQHNHKYRTVIRQLLLFSASEHFWNLLYFFSSIIAGTYQGLPTDKFLAGQGKTALLFCLAICPRGGAGSGSSGNFLPVFSQSLPISLEAFNGTSVPLHLGASKNLEYLSLGCAFRLQKSLKYQWAKEHQFEHRDLWLKELYHHPHRWWRNTSLPWPETVSVGMKNLPGSPLPCVPDMSSLFCKVTCFPCTNWQRRTYRLNI